MYSTLYEEYYLTRFNHQKNTTHLALRLGVVAPTEASESCGMRKLSLGSICWASCVGVSVKQMGDFLLREPRVDFSEESND